MRSRLIKALNNKFYVRFMQLEIGLYHLRQGNYKVKCNSDSSSHKARSVLLFCGPAHTDSLWPVLTRVKSGQAQFDVGQNGLGSQVGLEHNHRSFFVR